MVDVHTVKFYPAGINRSGQRVEHTLSFEFPLVAAGRGKHDGRRTPVAADEDAHRAAETLRVPTLIGATHGATV
jgi:hypothetical protein